MLNRSIFSASKWKKSMTWNLCAQIACSSAIAAHCRWFSRDVRKMVCDFRVAHINLNKFLARRVRLNNRLIFSLHCPKFEPATTVCVHHYPTSFDFLLFSNFFLAPRTLSSFFRYIKDLLLIQLHCFLFALAFLVAKMCQNHSTIGFAQHDRKKTATQRLSAWNRLKLVAQAKWLWLIANRKWTFMNSRSFSLASMTCATAELISASSHCS